MGDAANETLGTRRLLDLAVFMSLIKEFERSGS